MSIAPPPLTPHERELLAALRRRAADAQHDLLSAVSSFCRGPHQVVRHRDMLPPWCGRCRRTSTGLSVDELKADRRTRP